MGFFRSLVTGRPDPVVEAAAGPAFTLSNAGTLVGGADIDPAVFGIEAYATALSPAPRIERRTAMQCGAVKRSRDLVAGTLGTLPVTFTDAAGAPVRSQQLLEQPERSVARTVTMTRLFEDLFLEGVGWWRITERDYDGWPVHVVRLHPRSVDIGQRRDAQVFYRADGNLQGLADQWIPEADLIRFDSPTDGLLIAAARSIRVALHIERASEQAVDGAPPVDYFVPSGDSDPVEDDDVTELLEAWREARRLGRTAYVPAALDYKTAGWSPEQLQLGDMFEKACLRIAQHAGVDAEELGVNTTSRTYQNLFDRRKQFTDFTLGQFYSAVQDRLSMNDVCPRGQRASVDLDALLRSDPKSRFDAYAAGLKVGAITPERIADLEGLPAPITPAPEAPPVPTAPPLRGLPVAAQADPALVTFAEDYVAPIRLDSPQDAEAFEVDVEKRIIRGLVVPYGGAVAISNGQRFRFSQNTMTWSDVRRVKLCISHDLSQAVGVAFELDDRPEGLFGAFRVARGAEGDRALSLAEDGVLDGLSAGMKLGGTYRRGPDGVNDAVQAPVMEVSLTPAPAFDDARVHQVAAQADQEGNTTMPEGTPGGTATVDPTTDPTPATTGPDFSQLPAQLGAAIRDGFASLADPQNRAGGPEPVGVGGQQFEVREALPYRFDGVPGEHSFSSDLQASASGDQEARTRLGTFLEEAFAVTTGNVQSLNPTQNRPELYVPSLAFTRPLFEMVSSGTINDKTPFMVPKFTSSGGLVGNHTEGVEPTPGNFSAGVQTVTPGAMSGKIEIDREVWDQGGNPQADTIIWREMVNGYFEAVEAKVAAALKAVATAELNLASATDTALVNAMTSYFAGLQFVRGGNRFTGFAADGTLFPALIQAKDGNGRPLLPVLNPTNAQGETNGAFSEVQVGSQRVRAAWALGSGNAAQSYSFVPGSVWCWVSAPKRFTFEYQVKSIDMAVWGYCGTAVLRDSDVKPVDYTTADA